ncbi:MAG: hypothetical protein GXO22_00900 [Aquificae bacterium]|nr:hypothetical protein [Aquificota bacterium]
MKENPSKTIAKKIREYEEQIRLLELELTSFEEIESVEVDDEVIDIFFEQIDNVLNMDISQAREIIKNLLEEVKIEKNKIEGF